MSHLRRMTPASSSSPSSRRTNDLSLSLCCVCLRRSFSLSQKRLTCPHTRTRASRSYQPTPRFFLCPLLLPRSAPSPLLFFSFTAPSIVNSNDTCTLTPGRNFSAPIKSDDAGRGFSIYYEISLWVYKLVNDALAPLKRTPTRTHHGKRINRRRRLAELPLLFFRSLPLPFPVPLFFCATSSRVASSFISRVPPLPPFFFLSRFERLALFTYVDTRLRVALVFENFYQRISCIGIFTRRFEPRISNIPNNLR